MALTILAALILASAAYHFLGLRRHTLGRQIIFWLIFLAVSTAIVGKNGWTRPLVILFFINIGVAICSLCISGSPLYQAFWGDVAGAARAGHVEDAAFCSRQNRSGFEK